MKSDSVRYEEWLTTIANTRLLYNSLSELEDMLDAHCIHSNGIRRCFNSPQKLRSAFRDLKVEVELMTDGILSLDKVLSRYQTAWNFFRDNLYRRSNPRQVALELLSYCYPPYKQDGVGAKKTALFQRVIDEDVNVPFLVLMLLKVIPGYDSKEGDVIDFPHQFAQVIDLLEEFTKGSMVYDVLPSITEAKQEPNKTRLMLLLHVAQILDSYETFSSSANIYDMADSVKSSFINLDIVGFWNESEGKLVTTDFWRIEDAIDYGTYFLTHWHKDADNRLIGIRYAMFMFEGMDGRIIYYLLHPQAIKHRMDGLAYGDSDHAWYHTEMLADSPSVLPLQRLHPSAEWPTRITLTRCEDAKVLTHYDRWLKDCEVVKRYEKYEYTFFPNIYAVTKEHIFIPTGKDGEYYKVPRDAYEGFDRIQITDNVGTLIMNGHTYLAFDEFLLYIPTTPKYLREYGIEKVSEIK